jgi:hypothetical protein
MTELATRIKEMTELATRIKDFQLTLKKYGVLDMEESLL